VNVRHVVVIDNVDSFVFNLAEALARLGVTVEVVRNAVPAARALERARAAGALVVLSPGPGRPEDAGCCLELLALAKGRIPVFGVCLGHQAMVLEAGGRVEPVGAVVHGRASPLAHDGEGPLRGLPSPMLVGRYHSLCTREVPARFRVHARLGGMAMAISDPDARQVGVQFHPESILTPQGDRLLRNVLEDAQCTP
jgi:anthranilate synthase/aminodeoxychorismate synthase-like glutamine amidotransferase